MLGIVDGFLVEIDDPSDCTITALDGTSDATSPGALVSVDPSSDSGNTIRNLIDGTIAVTLVGDRPPSGTLKLIYTSDAEAISARRLLGRATSFSLTCASRASLDMTFVRKGAMSWPLHNDLENVWEFSVGFQEVTT